MNHCYMFMGHICISFCEGMRLLRQMRIDTIASSYGNSVQGCRCSRKRGKMRELKGMRELVTEEEGMGTVEVILIIVVLVGLVIIFKDQITDVVEKLFEKITTQTETV